jgi:hypothetical protein
MIVKAGDNIKTDFKEIGFEGIDWIYLAQNTDWCRAFVNKVGVP